MNYCVITIRIDVVAKGLLFRVIFKVRLVTFPLDAVVKVIIDFNNTDNSLRTNLFDTVTKENIS